MTTAIYYLGASVTSQNPGYRTFFHEKFQQWSDHEVTAIVDGIGGVGSLYGLASFKFRLTNEQLPNPELIIFDYSSGDLNLWVTPRNIIDDVLYQFFELLSRFRVPVIILINFRRDQICPDANAEYIIDIYKKYSDFFKFNIFNLHGRVSLLGNDVIDTLYRDFVHTTLEGSKYVADLLFSFTQKIFSIKYTPLSILRVLEYPLNKKYSLQKFSGEGLYIYPQTKEKFTYFQLDDKNLFFNYTGYIHALILVIGPESSFLKIKSVYGERLIRSFDRNCYYDRPHCIPLQTPLHCDGLISIDTDFSAEKNFSILKKPLKKIPNKIINKLVGFIGSNEHQKGKK